MEQSLLYYKYINLLDCDKLDRLSNIIKKSFNNHLLIVGNKGCGKMYFVNELLNSINGSKLNIKKKNTVSNHCLFFQKMVRVTGIEPARPFRGNGF